MGRSPGGGQSNPHQCSGLEHPHEPRSLAGYSPWDHEEWDIAERLSTCFNSKDPKGKNAPELSADPSAACVLGRSGVSHSVTLWTGVHQAPLSVDSSGQEYWSGLPFAPPGELPASETKPTSPALGGGFSAAAPLGKPRPFSYKLRSVRSFLGKTRGGSLRDLPATSELTRKKG